MMGSRGGKTVKTVMDAKTFSDAVADISRRAARDMDGDGICVIGIKTMGEFVARRIAGILSETTGRNVPLGVLDITLYRDDIGRSGRNWPRVKGTDMPFSLDGGKVLVVDDVIFTGRTARAAIEAITDYGRPSIIKLAVIADRGGREFPIQPDYCALKVSAKSDQRVVISADGKNQPEGVFIKSK